MHTLTILRGSKLALFAEEDMVQVVPTERLSRPGWCDGGRSDEEQSRDRFYDGTGRQGRTLKNVRTQRSISLELERKFSDCRRTIKSKSREGTITSRRDDD